MGKPLTKADGNAFFDLPRPGTAVEYLDGGGTKGKISRIGFDTIQIETRLGQKTKRTGYEGQLKITIPGFERAHALGGIVGHESPHGIYFTPRSINQEIQARGIEKFVSAIGDNIKPGQKLYLTVTVVRESISHKVGNDMMKVDFLKEITYTVHTEPGKTQSRIFEAGFKIDKPNDVSSRPNFSRPDLSAEFNRYSNLDNVLSVTQREEISKTLKADLAKEPKKPQDKSTQKAEKGATVPADQKGAAKPPARIAESPRATDTNGIKDHLVGDGRPAQAERATTPARTAGNVPSAPTVQDTLNNFGPRQTPSAEQVKTLETSLNTGLTNVTNIGGNQIKVTLKKGGLMAVKAYKAANNPVVGVLSLIDERIPALDPNSLIQAKLEKYVAAGIQKSRQWVDVNYGPVDELLKAEVKARENYDKAKEELNDQEDNWRRLLRQPPTSKLWVFANRQVTQYLTSIDNYRYVIETRNSELAAQTNRLEPLSNEIQEYSSLLAKLSSELEDKAKIALMIPYGYYFGLELFSFSQFVEGLRGQVSGLGGTISLRALDYHQAIEKGLKVEDEMNVLYDKWEGVLATAQEAAGI